MSNKNSYLDNKPKPKKTAIFILATAALVMFFGISALIVSNSFFNSDEEFTNSAIQCGDTQLIDDFYRILVSDAEDKYLVFSDFTNNIRSVSGHDTQPDCLYMLAVHGEYTGNGMEAIAKYEQILAINDQSGEWISEPLGTYSVADLQKKIEQLREIEESLDTVRSRGFLPSPIPSGVEL